MPICPLCSIPSTRLNSRARRNNHTIPTKILNIPTTHPTRPINNFHPNDYKVIGPSILHWTLAMPLMTSLPPPMTTLLLTKHLPTH